MLERRDFLKTGIGLAATGLVHFPLCAQSTDLPADVIAVKGESPYAITKAAISALGGMQKFVTRQSVVMIKPNIAFPRAPKIAATTNPEVVKALIELCLEAGAKTVRVMDNPVGHYKGPYEQSGIEAVVKAAGAEMVVPDTKRLVAHHFGGGFLKGLNVFKDFLEIDTFINVPILKSHSMTQLTLGMKNLMGTIQHRELFHGRDRGERIAELARGLPPHLTVIDAWRVMHSGGPDSGPTTDIKTVLVSTKITECDAVAAAMAGRQPKSIPYIEAAATKKMGEIDLKKIKVASYQMNA